MGKILVIAEKPSVGRDIAKVLKCNIKGDGYLYSDKYIVCWSIGHLVTLYEPQDYDINLKKWTQTSLPIIPKEIMLKPIPNTKKQLNILKKLMNSKEVDSLICATDSGREGELIFRYIYSIVKCKKPFKRLWISSMTDTAIKEGLLNIKDGKLYDNLYHSARCRSVADWLVGINSSRAYTIKYNTLLSIGRVQTPTLEILVKRQKEIDAFKPQTYFEVQALFDGYSGIWFDPKTLDTKITDKSFADAISLKIKGLEGTVTNISKEQKKQPHGLLYDLTELQRDCNKKFGFSAKKTLSIAQELYERKKLITYPRTDSRYLSKDIIPKLKIILNKLDTEPYKSYIKYIISLDKLPITKRIIDDSKVTDHHAIIPTESKINLHSLSSDEHKVYDTVVRKFLSVFYTPYIYEVTKITTTVSDENFITKGITVINLGFTELYKNEKSKKEPEELLPKVSIGDKVKLLKTIILTKKTQPPKTYTEASLLSAMENAGKLTEDEELKEKLKESGLGTPATRAAMIERLIDVGYVTRSGKTLTPTEKGMLLTSVVPNELRSPETTGKWERGLTSISKGNMEPDRFINSIYNYVHYIIKCSLESSNEVIFPKEKNQFVSNKNMLIGLCPKCSGSVLENSKAFYCNNNKKGCKFTIWKNSILNYDCKLTTNIIKKLLKDKKVNDLHITLTKTKEKFTASLIINQKSNDGFELIDIKRKES